MIVSKPISSWTATQYGHDQSAGRDFTGLPRAADEKESMTRDKLRFAVEGSIVIARLPQKQAAWLKEIDERSPL